MTRPRFINIFSRLVALAVLTGCASLPEDVEREESLTVVAKQGHLAELLEPYKASHPGESGFFILDRGDQAFAARMAMAELAEESISAQYFIWKRDLSSLVLAQAVLDAADRGVNVRLLLDDFDTKGGRDWEFTVLDAHPNIELRIFNPFAVRSKLTPLRKRGEFVVKASRLNNRMHNKIFMVDGQAAIVGGRNIGDEYFGVSDNFNFRDLDLLAVGPVAKKVGNAFDTYWNSEWAYPVSALKTKKVTRDEDQRHRQLLHELTADVARIEAILPDSSRSLDERLTAFADNLIWAESEVIYDVPEKVSGEGLEDQPVSLVTARLYELGATLENELLVETAYFIPRRDGVSALASLVDKGVDVRVLTNSLASNNHASAHSGYRRYRKSLVESGIKMFELSRYAAATPEHRFVDEPDAFLGLHSKAAVFDRKSVFIGTLNLDPRSIVLNTEMGLLVHSEALAEELARSMERDMAAENSWRVRLSDSNLVRWTIQRDGETVIEKNEPDASLYRKAISWIAGLLPIEGQL